MLRANQIDQEAERLRLEHDAIEIESPQQIERGGR